MRKSKPLLIHLICCPDERIGYGVHAINLANGLLKNSENKMTNTLVTDPRNSLLLNKNLEIINKHYKEYTIVNVHLTDGSDQSLIKSSLPGYKVIYTVFESNVLPLGWKENLEKFDLVITASNWGKIVLLNELDIDNITVVPEGVDPSIYNTNGRDIYNNKKDIFKFLMIGKYEIRKSYEESIKAFLDAFDANEKCQLLLKPDNYFAENVHEIVDSFIPKDRKHQVIIISKNNKNQYISKVEMSNLYKSCHCFVFPSKGEGWGLPLIEAISCGTPFIATNYSGHSHFLKSCIQDYSDVKFRTEIIKHNDYFRYNKFKSGSYPLWAIPDIKSLSSNMLSIKSNWDSVYNQALKNSKKIQNEFSWSSSAEKFKDEIIKFFN